MRHKKPSFTKCVTSDLFQANRPQKRAILFIYTMLAIFCHFWLIRQKWQNFANSAPLLKLFEKFCKRSIICGANRAALHSLTQYTRLLVTLLFVIPSAVC